MDQKYHSLLSSLRPYIVCHPSTLHRVKTDFMNLSIEREHQYNPLVLSSQKFIESLMQLDALSFGPGGMGMPKWVFFDCALIPGAIIGFGIDGHKLSDADRKLLHCHSNDFVPLSMYIAIPNADNESWFGHNLSSLNGIINYPLGGLGLLTKFYALGVLGIKKLIGATQWDSPALGLHLKLSEMKLLASYVPIHTHHNTLCYESSNFYSMEQVFTKFKYNLKGLDKITGSLEEIKSLQSQIENGQEFWLVKGDTRQSVFYLKHR